MSTTRKRPPSASSVQPRIGRGSAGLRLTPAEFDAIRNYDPRYRYELVEGVLVVNPIPLEAQASPNEYLGGLLFVYQHTHPQGSALDLTLPERYIHLPNSRRLADRVIWAGLGRRPDPKVDLPTIAVEFVSAGKRNRHRDYELKRDEYLTAGVVEYWIIDRFDRTMTVYRAGKDGPTQRIVREDETFRTDLLPGFELPLAKLLAEADKWTKNKTR